MILDRIGRFEVNAAPPRQRRKSFFGVVFEVFHVTKLFGSDYEPETPISGELSFEEAINFSPTAPMLPRRNMETRGTEFEHELAEDERRDGRK